MTEPYEKKKYHDSETLPSVGAAPQINIADKKEEYEEVKRLAPSISDASFKTANEQTPLVNEGKNHLSGLTEAS